MLEQSSNQPLSKFVYTRPSWELALMWVKEEGAGKPSPWCLFSDPAGLGSHDAPADTPRPFL